MLVLEKTQKNFSSQKFLSIKNLQYKSYYSHKNLALEYHS